MAKLSNEDRVIEAVRGAKNSGDSLITLSNGVVLKAKRVPTLLFPEVVKQFPQPKIPIVFIEDTGRDEENPNDPQYISDMSQWNANISVAIVDLMILIGTELESVPKGFPKPTDRNWDNKLKLIGVNPGDDEDKRYLMWVKFVAAPESDDVEKITVGVGRLSGVSEEDVAETVKQFRNQAE